MLTLPALLEGGSSSSVGAKPCPARNEGSPPAGGTQLTYSLSVGGLKPPLEPFLSLGQFSGYNPSLNEASTSFSHLEMLNFSAAPICSD